MEECRPQWSRRIRSWWGGFSEILFYSERDYIICSIFSCVCVLFLDRCLDHYNLTFYSESFTSTAFKFRQCFVNTRYTDQNCFLWNFSNTKSDILREVYGTAELDLNIIPYRTNEEFLRKDFMFALLNGWSMSVVGPHNFVAKWYAGRARPEEVVWLIKRGKIRGAPSDIERDVREMNIRKASDFTAYDEGCPNHVSALVYLCWSFSIATFQYRTNIITCYLSYIALLAGNACSIRWVLVEICRSLSLELSIFIATWWSNTMICHTSIPFINSQHIVLVEHSNELKSRSAMSS